MTAVQGINTWQRRATFLNNTTGEIKHKKNEAWLGAIYRPCKVNHNCICAFIGLVFCQSRLIAEGKPAPEAQTYCKPSPQLNQIVKRSRYMPGFRLLGPQLAASPALSAGSGLAERWTTLFSVRAPVKIAFRAQITSLASFHSAHIFMTEKNTLRRKKIK